MLSECNETAFTSSLLNKTVPHSFIGKGKGTCGRTEERHFKKVKINCGVFFLIEITRLYRKNCNCDNKVGNKRIDSMLQLLSRFFLIGILFSTKTIYITITS
jgi:hypothetical protein